MIRWSLGRFISAVKPSGTFQSLAEAIQAYDPQVPVEVLRRSARTYRAPPWIVLQLLTDSNLSLKHIRCVELLEWAKEEVNTRREDEKTMTEAMKCVKAMWDTMVAKHTVGGRALQTYLSICFVCCDTESFCNAYQWAKCQPQRNSTNLWPNRRVTALALRLARSVTDRGKGGLLLDEVLEDLRRPEGDSMLRKSIGLCTEVILTLWAFGDRDEAREWLTFHFNVFGTTPDIRVCKLFPDIDWVAKVDPLTETGALLAPSVEEAVRIGKASLPLAEASLVRVCELSIPGSPSCLREMITLMDHIRGSPDTGGLGRPLGPHHYEGFVKVLCDERDAGTAWATIQSMKQSGMQPTLTTYADVLVCLGTESTARSECLRKLREHLMDDPTSVHAHYSYALRRYVEHRKMSDVVDALEFLEIELRTLGVTREEGVSVVVSDGTFADVVYDSIDTSISPSLASKLLHWICRTCPEIDEIVIGALTEFSVKKKNVLHTYRSPREMFDSLKAFRDYFTPFQRIYVLDTSVLESIGATHSDIVEALSEGSGTTGGVCGAVIPLVALRELCVSLRKLSVADENEYRTIIVEATRNAYGLAAEGAVTLIHPTEDLLMRVYAPQVVGMGLELKDDNDRVVYTYRFLQSLLPEVEVLLASADTVLLQRADQEGIRTVAVTGPQEGLLPSEQQGTTPSHTAEDDLIPAVNLPAAPSALGENTRPLSLQDGFSEGFEQRPDRKQRGLSNYWRQRRKQGLPNALIGDMMKYKKNSAQGSARDRTALLSTLNQLGISKKHSGGRPFWQLPVQKVNINHPANRHYLDDYRRLMGQKRAKEQSRILSRRHEGS